MALQPLATEIAADGGEGCERENTYAHVLLALVKELVGILAQHENSAKL